MRRISTARRTDAVSGTDFTLDDLFGFSGIVPQYEWVCLAEARVIAPMNSKVKAYPYERGHDFGPCGLSFASDRWELRDAYVVRMLPENADHPYPQQEIYLDKQIFKPHYAFAYGQKQERWKIIWHNKRWSEDGRLVGKWYPDWEGIARARDLVLVGDIVVNVQTGTGNRIEFWERNGVPLESKSQIRRFIDVGRLSRGR